MQDFGDILDKRAAGCCGSLSDRSSIKARDRADQNRKVNVRVLVTRPGDASAHSARQAKHLGGRVLSLRSPQFCDHRHV